jgi:hypothetical protein
VDEEKMVVVRRVFRMVGAEGAGIYGVHETLEREGVPAPGGGKYWDKRAVKRWILDDAYRPHTHEEISSLVRPEVAARMDPQKSYGDWWFNRRRTSLTQVSGPKPRQLGAAGHAGGLPVRCRRPLASVRASCSSLIEAVRHRRSSTYLSSSRVRS